MEIIAADRKMRPCNEPFNLRKPEVVRRLGISNWESLASQESLPRIEEYLRRLAAGGIGYSWKNMRPFQRGYHFLTNRVVFKLLFACEERISWLRETFGANIIVLIRHPIPVSISREETPRLQALMRSETAASLTNNQRKFAEHVFEQGTQLEKAQLDWCLQNLPLLRHPDLADLLITYEQLVLQTEVIVDKVSETLNLVDNERVLEASNKLSSSVSKSSKASKKLLLDREDDQLSLIAKWRKTVSSVEEKNLMRILEEFGIDAYRYGNLLPSQEYWIGSNYPEQNLP